MGLPGRELGIFWLLLFAYQWSMMAKIVQAPPKTKDIDLLLKGRSSFFSSAGSAAFSLVQVMAGAAFQKVSNRVPFVGSVAKRLLINIGADRYRVDNSYPADESLCQLHIAQSWYLESLMAKMEAQGYLGSDKYIELAVDQRRHVDRATMLATKETIDYWNSEEGLVHSNDLCVLLRQIDVEGPTQLGRYRDITEAINFAERRYSSELKATTLGIHSQESTGRHSSAGKLTAHGYVTAAIGTWGDKSISLSAIFATDRSSTRELLIKERLKYSQAYDDAIALINLRGGVVDGKISAGASELLGQYSSRLGRFDSFLNGYQLTPEQRACLSEVAISGAGDTLSAFICGVSTGLIDRLPIDSKNLESPIDLAELIESDFRGLRQKVINS